MRACSCTLPSLHTPLLQPVMPPRPTGWHRRAWRKLWLRGAQSLGPPDASCSALQVASPAAIASAEKEGEARLKSCTTEECRSVINALNTKRLAKLKGVLWVHHPLLSSPLTPPCRQASPRPPSRPTCP